MRTRRAQSQFDCELQSVLEESQSSAERRETTAFEQALAGCKSVVIFGAGGLGRRVVTALRESGLNPVALADNNPSLWKERVNGIEVLPPAVAAQRFGSHALFLIAIWHPSKASIVSSVRKQLSDLGCRHIAAFPVALWKYSESLLPYYLWDLPSKLLSCSEAITSTLPMFDDDASKLEFVRQIRLRALGDFESLLPPGADAQYFPPDLVTVVADECFVDCGAYNGDSLSDFVAHCGGDFRRVIAFEPDPVNLAGLRERVQNDGGLSGRTAIYDAAVGAASGIVQFNANGLASASVCQGDGLAVRCVALDDVLSSEQPTFIKMDIEGAELAALAGAQECIRRHRPLLAICVYHQQDHLWRIPLAVRELLPDSRIYLRAHCADGFDVVCYAVPGERAMRGLR